MAPAPARDCSVGKQHRRRLDRVVASDALRMQRGPLYTQIRHTAIRHKCANTHESLSAFARLCQPCPGDNIASPTRGQMETQDISPTHTTRRHTYARTQRSTRAAAAAHLQQAERDDEEQRVRQDARGRTEPLRHRPRRTVACGVATHPPPIHHNGAQRLCLRAREHHPRNIFPIKSPTDTQQQSQTKKRHQTPRTMAHAQNTKIKHSQTQKQTNKNEHARMPARARTVHDAARERVEEHVLRRRRIRPQQQPVRAELPHELAAEEEQQESHGANGSPDHVKVRVSSDVKVAASRHHTVMHAATAHPQFESHSRSSS